MMDSVDRLLRWAAVVFVVGSASHNVDHWRIDILNTPSATLRAGYVLISVQVVAVALALLGHRLAPIAAIAAGAGTALGFALVHLPPDWARSASRSGRVRTRRPG